MAVRVSVSGTRELEAAFAKVADSVKSELADAVEAEADAVVQDARDNVRQDSGDLHDSITAEVVRLSAEIRPRSSASSEDARDHAIKANVNEFGRAGDQGQPYMVPAAELSRQRWPKRARDAVKRGTKG